MAVLTTGWAIWTNSTVSSVDGECVPAFNNSMDFKPAKGNRAVKSNHHKQYRGIPPENGFPFGQNNSTARLKGGSDSDKKLKPPTLTANKHKSTQTIEMKNVISNAAAKSGKDAGSVDTRLVGNFYFLILAFDECGTGDCSHEKYVQYDVLCCRTATGCTTFMRTAPELRNEELPYDNPNPIQP